MADKLHEYQGVGGRWHEARDRWRQRWRDLRETRQHSFGEYLRDTFLGIPSSEEPEKVYENTEYSDIFRRKSRLELMRISAAVMGIEFSYAGETAFVSPTLLQIGVRHQHMTLVWALSPLLGLLLTPLLGSVSDGCRSRLGRRRPFILVMSLGVLLGLILVPNGEDMGYGMGDPRPRNVSSIPTALGPRSATLDAADAAGGTSHPWGVFFTVLGTVFLDFDADACQSPARAYLLDVTVPEDHAKGLSTFTVMAGLGGFMGYSLGGVNWDETSLGVLFGGHVRAVFSLITVIFVACVATTVCSFREIPLDELRQQMELRAVGEETPAGEGAAERAAEEAGQDPEKSALKGDGTQYGTLTKADSIIKPAEPPPLASCPAEHLTLRHYLRSVVLMPPSLRLVCLTNLFCWMAHVCYSLYFTDFVGEAVFGGNPTAPEGSFSRLEYERGVRFGCWGMAMYSLSCACYSLIIERLIKRLGAKRVYVGGLCTYSCGMFMLFAIRARAAVILFSWTAGIMYSTLFTMPYLLVAHYHATGMWANDGGGCGEARGLGTDVAAVSSCVFVAQLLVSLIMGAAVRASGSTAAVVAVAAALAAAAAASATQITYLDL